VDAVDVETAGQMQAASGALPADAAVMAAAVADWRVELRHASSRRAKADWPHCASRKTPIC
jgi:phosphopantothenoylcysteine decarboxylase/phosphopantothenate--cysteine ligase